MIKNFIFDMGNVLIDFSPDYILSQYTDDLETIRTLKERIFYHNHWLRLDNGDVSFEEAAVLIKAGAPDCYHSIIDRVLESWHIHKLERHEMTNFVKDLKEQGFSLYLLSNAASRFHEYKDDYAVFQYFDGIVISADYQMSKPDALIYKKLIDTYALVPQECIFIDDTVQNIRAAEALGMFGYSYNGNLCQFKKFIKNTKIL